MKTIQITLKTFSELDKEAQRKAIEHFRDINTDHGWWQYEYEGFTALCTSLGIQIKPNGINFRGLYSQGDGSCFASDIDACTLIKSVAGQLWKSYAPTLEVDMQPCPLDRRVTALLEQEHVEAVITTSTSHRYYFLHFHCEFQFYGKHGREYKNIGKELQKLEKWVLHILEGMNAHLYTALKETYEYLTSDTAIQEAIVSNEYYFTPDGRHADYLLGYEE